MAGFVSWNISWIVIRSVLFVEPSILLAPANQIQAAFSRMVLSLTDKHKFDCLRRNVTSKTPWLQSHPWIWDSSMESYVQSRKAIARAASLLPWKGQPYATWLSLLIYTFFSIFPKIDTRTPNGEDGCMAFNCLLGPTWFWLATGNGNRSIVA